MPLPALLAILALTPPLEIEQLIPLMVDVDGQRRSLCLEIPTSPTKQPNNTADGTIVDVWRCDNFPPLGTTVVDGRDKWVKSGVVDFELRSAVTAVNQSAPKCLSFAGFAAGRSDLADVRVSDCAKGRPAGVTTWNLDASGTRLVNKHSGLCLQVHVDKHKPHAAASSG